MKKKRIKKYNTLVSKNTTLFFVPKTTKQVQIKISDQNFKCEKVSIIMLVRIINVVETRDYKEGRKPLNQ
jgi:hypothetical protein